MSEDLTKIVPDANYFFQEVLENINEYKLFADEVFVEYSMGVLATSGIDRHGESFGVEGLKAAENKINTQGLWMQIMHDPTIQPAGRVIKAKIFISEDKKEYHLIGVMGRYSIENIKKFNDVGISLNSIEQNKTKVLNSLFKEYDQRDGKFIIRIDPNGFDIKIMKEAYDEIPKNIEVDIQRGFYKALDPLTIISVPISLFFLSKTPFLDEIQKEAAKDFYKWLKNYVYTKLILIKKRVIFEFTIEHRECLVRLIIESKNPKVLSEATDKIDDAVESVYTLLEAYPHYGFQILIYEYNTNTSSWSPLHAATSTHGVISERVELIDMHGLNGLSLGGSSRNSLIKRQNE